MITVRPFGYGPTGNVFNATPTYEFGTEVPADARRRVARFQVEHVVRRTLWKAARKVGIR